MVLRHNYGVVLREKVDKLHLRVREHMITSSIPLPVRPPHELVTRPTTGDNDLGSNRHMHDLESSVYQTNLMLHATILGLLRPEGNFSTDRGRGTKIY